MSRKLAVFSALAMVLATAAGAMGAPEFEPNDDRNNADVIAGYPCYEPGIGHIDTGNSDYWIVATPKGSQLWAHVDPQGANSHNVFLRAEALSGALLEEDFDDGDDSLGGAETGLIAGRDVGSVRRAFLKVTEAGNDASIDTYSLQATITKGHVAEIEPNDGSSDADLALRCPHVRSGLISSPSDEDWFGFSVTGPRRIFLALDADPGRTGATDLVLSLHEGNGAPLNLTDRSATETGAAEGFQWDLPGAGAYFAKVRGSGSSTGDYRLLISGLPKVKCNKKFATMTGSPAADLIRGTNGGDVISSFGGADRVFGGRGADRQCGGGGADRLAGGRGFDRLYGGGGADKLIGGKNDDLCVGGNGSDTTTSC